MKRTAVALLNLLERIVYRVRLWRIVLNENIEISSSAVLSGTCVMDVSKGGKISIGEQTQIHHGVLLMTYGGNIQIGNRCSINPYCLVYGHGGVMIGDDVLIAGGCMIIPANHRFADNARSIKGQGVTKVGITIESDVWIGHGCSILDGTTIGRGAVIAAGTVVNRDIPPMSVVAGVPAKVIRSRLE